MQYLKIPGRALWTMLLFPFSWLTPYHYLRWLRQTGPFQKSFLSVCHFPCRAISVLRPFTCFWVVHMMRCLQFISVALIVKLWMLQDQELVLPISFPAELGIWWGISRVAPILLIIKPSFLWKPFFLSGFSTKDKVLLMAKLANHSMLYSNLCMGSKVVTNIL